MAITAIVATLIRVVVAIRIGIVITRATLAMTTRAIQAIDILRSGCLAK